MNRKIYVVLVALVTSLVIGALVTHEPEVQHEHKVAAQRVGQKAEAQQQALQYMYGERISGENTQAHKAGVPSDLRVPSGVGIFSIDIALFIVVAIYAGIFDA
jgi:hypothetical protein